MSAPEIPFTAVNEEVVTRRQAVYRNSPSSSIPNKLGTFTYGTRLVRIGISDEFSKVLYKGKVVYIDNKDLRVG